MINTEFLKLKYVLYLINLIFYILCKLKFIPKSILKLSIANIGQFINLQTFLDYFLQLVFFIIVWLYVVF